MGGDDDNMNLREVRTPVRVRVRVRAWVGG